MPTGHTSENCCCPQSRSQQTRDKHRRWTLRSKEGCRGLGVPSPCNGQGTGMENTDLKGKCNATTKAQFWVYEKLPGNEVSKV